MTPTIHQGTDVKAVNVHVGRLSRCGDLNPFPGCLSSHAEAVSAGVSHLVQFNAALD